MMKPLDDQEAMDKEAAIVLLQQRIHACRLCQEHGYIREAHPLTSGRGSDRVMVIGQAPGHRSSEHFSFCRRGGESTTYNTKLPSKKRSSPAPVEMRLACWPLCVVYSPCVGELGMKRVL